MHVSPGPIQRTGRCDSVERSHLYVDTQGSPLGSGQRGCRGLPTPSRGTADTPRAVRRPVSHYGFSERSRPILSTANTRATTDVGTGWRVMGRPRRAACRLWGLDLAHESARTDGHIGRQRENAAQATPERPVAAGCPRKRRIVCSPRCETGDLLPVGGMGEESMSMLTATYLVLSIVAIWIIDRRAHGLSV